MSIFQENFTMEGRTMDRPYRFYEKVLAEIEAEKLWKSANASRGRHVLRQNKKMVMKIDPGREDGGYDFNFPNELMTKRKLAKKTGVPYSAICDFIKQGLLTPIRFPGYSYEKYSPALLEKLVKNYNKLF